MIKDINFEEEFLRQETNSNKKAINGFWIFFGAVFLTWILTLANIFIISKTMMTICFIVTSLIMIAPIYIKYKVDMSLKWVKYLMLTLASINCGIITSILSIHAILLFPIPLLLACQYRDRIVLWYTFAISSFAMIASCFISFYYGICDLNMLFMSSKTREYYLSLIENGSAHLELNTNIIFGISVYQVLPRFALMLIYTIILRFLVLSNYNDAIRIVQLTHSKNTDVRTGLYNKRKLEELEESFYPDIDRVAVAFFDLNNLKFINDNYGHEEGDNLIKAFADILMREQNHRCNAFRFGGDEFILVLDHAVLGEIESIVEHVHKRAEKTKEIKGVKISAAVGTAYGSGSDIKELLKKADDDMYTNKIDMKGNAR